MLSVCFLGVKRRSQGLHSTQHTAPQKHINWKINMRVCTKKVGKRYFSTIWYGIFQKAGILLRVPCFFTVKAVCHGVLKIVVCQGVQTASTDISASVCIIPEHSDWVATQLKWLFYFRSSGENVNTGNKSCKGVFGTVPVFSLPV